MQQAAIIRQAEVSRDHKNAAINTILTTLDGIDGKVSADMGVDEIAGVLVQHEALTTLEAIKAASPEWANAITAAEGRYIRIH